MVRPVRELTLQEQIDGCFTRYRILCRETAALSGLSWQEALSILRIQEYTGQVRRGYFVEGLSGAQFIRSEEFAGVTSQLLHPVSETVWISAADPIQPWGKLLAHMPGREFINISGNAVALQGGIPIAVMERQGQVLRIFEEDHMEEVLRLFAESYKQGRLFVDKKRIQVKEYPKEAAGMLEKSGFSRQVQGYALYR